MSDRQRDEFSLWAGIQGGPAGMGSPSGPADYLKWKPTNQNVAFENYSNMNPDINHVQDMHRGSTGSMGSIRSSSSGSLSNPPTPTTAPLVIPQPIKPVKTGRTYSCKMCDQVFNTKSDMLIHSQQIHKQDPKPYRCPTCNKSFANSSYLSQHARIHAGIKPYKCDICERKFTQLSHLQQHIRTHTGEKPYKCSHPGCGKAFSQLSNLQSHSRSHMTDKPYRCNSCYKCYADEQGLREHIPKHSDTKHLKTQICRICGKSYTQETYLERHMQKHSQDSVSKSSSQRGGIKQEPLDHHMNSDYSRIADRAQDRVVPSCVKTSSAFMPLSQFGNITAPSGSGYHHQYNAGLSPNSLGSPLPHISSMASPRYLPYDTLAFRKMDPTDRNMPTLSRDSMLANSLLSLQHIKDFAASQSFTQSCSGTGPRVS